MTEKPCAVNRYTGLLQILGYFSAFLNRLKTREERFSGRLTNNLFREAISKFILLSAAIRAMHSPHRQTTNLRRDNQREGLAAAIHSDDDFLGLKVEDCIKRSWRNSVIRRAVAHHDPNLYFDILFFMNLWRCRVDGDEEDIVSGEIPKRLQDMRIKK
uniref:DUF4372 domain-containing protein n=1 Tax=Ascaris lumbricoides TaxID=6252 RepID=A0A0M3HVA9_ASCLU